MSDKHEEPTITLSRRALSELGVYVTDVSEPSKGFSSCYWRDFGLGSQTTVSQTWRPFVHADDVELIERLLTGDLSDIATEEGVRFRVRDTNGNWHWILSKGMVESVDSDGAPTRYIGFNHEITKSVEQEEELREARRIAEEQAMEGETLRTAGAVITSSLSRLDIAQYVATHLSEIVPADGVFIFEKVDRSLVTLDGLITVDEEPSNDASQPDTAFLQSPLGREILYELVRHRVPNIATDPSKPHDHWLFVPLVSRNMPIGVLAVVRRDGQEFHGREIRFAMAISDYMSLALVNARLYEEMHQLATVDQLSGLLTRRAFFERAEQVILGLEESTSVTAIILDIDHFKRINDDFGHRIGDGAIRVVARAFRDELRERDVIGRYGGEEFCALLPSTVVSEGRAVAERICNTVRGISVDGVDRAITVSIGVASSRDGCRTDLSDLLNNADTSLYRAKRNGRDTVEVYADLRGVE